MFLRLTGHPAEEPDDSEPEDAVAVVAGRR
jgi:hypothetical protein